MKKLIAGAGLALAATSALAADPFEVQEDPARQISGYGQIYAGGVWAKFAADGLDTFHQDFWVAGALGQINIPFADAWNAQGGLSLDGVNSDGEWLVGFGGQAHLFWRDPSTFALGGFIDLKKYDFPYDESVNVWDWKIGPEAQLYLDRVTLYGQAWYGQAEIEDESSYDIAGVRGVVRYFAQDNLRFDGELAFSRLAAGEDDVDNFSAALQAMYRFTDTPVSLYARYQFDSMSFHNGFQGIDIDTHKLVAGLRVSFGNSTLIEEDRNGASMDTHTLNSLFPGF